jgi:hypothetical protein
MRYFPAIASTAIVHCWVCNYSFRDRGSRFCSARCREHYDSGASTYDRHHAGKVFDVPLRSWKVVAGPPASMLGASYYAPLLGRSHCHQQHEAPAREAMRRDEPVVCCNPACGRTIRRLAQAKILLDPLPESRPSAGENPGNEGRCQKQDDPP